MNMANKKLVMCTSSGCLEYGPERYRNLGIDIIRIHLHFKGKEYLEGLDLDPVDLYKQMENTKEVKDNLPHTSMPTYDEVSEHFKKAIENGYDEVICICLSSGLGGTWNFVRLVSEDFKDQLKVTVIDAKTTCFNEGYLAILAKRLIDEGKDTETIIKELNWSISHQKFIGLAGKLDYLIFNGRLKGGKAYMGKLMKIVPVLHFNQEGVLVPWFNAIGVKNAINKTCELLKDEVIKGRDSKDYILLHVFTGESIVKKVREQEKEFGIETNHEDIIMSPVSGIHCGPWLAGYNYIPLRREDEPLE